MAKKFKVGDRVKVYREPTAEQRREDWISPEMDQGVGLVGTVVKCDFFMEQAEVKFDDFPLGGSERRQFTNGPSGWSYWFAVLEKVK